MLAAYAKFIQALRPKSGWMNPRAKSNTAYMPTSLEHIANIITHGCMVLPSAIGGIILVHRSSSSLQYTAAVIYGTALSCLFLVSTTFHFVFYSGNNKLLKDILHRSDRAMIYLYIAASYFPWLSLKQLDGSLANSMRYYIWPLALVGIMYQQLFHEKYKWLETTFYLSFGLGPAMVLAGMENKSGVGELMIGGCIYVVGVLFFKLDGRVPCAHAIWHCHVAIGSIIHYYAIFNYLIVPM